MCVGISDLCGIRWSFKSNEVKRDSALSEFSENEAKKQEISNHDFLKMFLDAKKIEGCSERTIQYYKVTVEH